MSTIVTAADLSTPGTPRGSHPSVGFVLEQSLGHVTHAENLMELVSRDPTVDAQWILVPWEVAGPAGHLPLYRDNWTVRAGLRARRAIRARHRATTLDALFIHTQVPAVLARPWLRRIPTVVSVDATPLQYDELGAFYRHRRSPAAVERLKWRANHACFRDAVHLVSWSRWAKDGLVADYGVSPDKVTVLAPGVDVCAWERPRASIPDDGTVRILFVGSDLDRKGGRLLLEAFRRLRDDQLRTRDVELHLVTGADVSSEPGVVVHRGLAPNSPDLKAVYHRADVFCLPTRGDCLPMVLSEAGAAGLPLVSTNVGAIREIVRDGETGFLVPPDDGDALHAVLRRLVADPALRRRLGARANDVVEADFNAATNARRLVALLRDVAATDRRPREYAPLRSSERGGRRVLLTVSGTVPTDVHEQVERGSRPRPDYVALAGTLGADVLDHARAREEGGASGRLVERLAGPHALLAWASFRRRRDYTTIFSDGEQVGLPFAILCRLAGRGGSRHVMIGHLLSAPKKARLFQLFRLGAMIDTIFVYATAQQRFVEEQLRVTASKVVRTPFMVDTTFFSPVPLLPGPPMVCSAGLEYRDYPTLVEAIRGLDVEVVLAAASPWSKRPDSTEGVAVPDNVRVCQLGFEDLRQLYAESLFVVVPLEESPFQAGVTTILEAMAMGKAVVCTRTTGQTDVVIDGVTGLYVPPGDPMALRAVIQHLVDNPHEARRMGRAGRRLCVQEMDVDRYAERLARCIHVSGSARQGRSLGHQARHVNGDELHGSSGRTRGSGAGDGRGRLDN
jgi:glycosyltransferase involved in cell wall biosynthesis